MANTAAVLRYREFWKMASVLPASYQDSIFPTLELPALISLLPNGLHRGTIAEISGLRSSGRSAVTLHILAQATARGEVCAVVDLSDTFNPASGAAAGLQLDRLLWVRCHGKIEHAMRAADLLLHAGGFGVVLLDLCEANRRMLERIPLSYWYRFRRAVEDTPAILLLCAELPQANSCAFSSFALKVKRFHWSGEALFQILRGIEASVIPGKRLPARAEAVSLRMVI